MSLRNIAPVAVLGLSLLLGAGALMSQARQNNAANQPAGLMAGSIAMVDMQRVYLGSTAPHELELKAADIENEMGRQINSILSVPLLNQAELQEYVGILNKPGALPAEKARMTALKTLSDQRATELETLKTKNPLLPAEKARLNELMEQSRFLNQILPTIREAMNGSKKAQMDAIYQEQMAQLRTIVAQIAKQKNIEHVFDTSALVYSGTDLTPLVLQQLNKRPNK